MKDLIIENIGIFLSAIATGFGGWFYGRKRAQTEYESSQIENAEKLLNYYKNLVDDLGSRLEKAIKKFNEAEATIRELEGKVDNLTKELQKYKQLNGKTL